MAKNLPKDSTAVLKLKKMVGEFSETMPIVESLANKSLKKVHWTEIREIMTIPEDFPIEERLFTLGDLIKFDVAPSKQEIVEVSNVATQESILKTKIEQIKTEVNYLEFQTGAIHQAEAVRIKNFDRLQEILDDHLESLRSIQSSKYIRRLAVETTKLRTKINLLVETVE